MLTCLWIAVDDLLNSKKKNGFLREGRVVEFGLRSTIKFFRLLWETLAALVSGPTSCAWVEHAGIFQQSNLHFVFQLLEYASSLVSIVYMCLCNFLLGM